MSNINLILSIDAKYYLERRMYYTHHRNNLILMKVNSKEWGVRNE